MITIRTNEIAVMPPAEEARSKVHVAQKIFTTMLAGELRRSEQKRIAENAKQTFLRTKGFYDQYESCKTQLIAETERINGKVVDGLAKDPNFQGCRQAAVRLALKCEAIDILMGGKGSGHWNEEQCSEICRTGKIHGYHGHHINNVANHPLLQADKNNVVFCLPDEHLRLHLGCFRNPTEGKLIDRDKMLWVTNMKRVTANEVKGGLSLIPDMVFSFCMNTAFCSSDRNITAKERLRNGGKAALKIGGKKAVDYLFARLCAKLID